MNADDDTPVDQSLAFSLGITVDMEELAQSLAHAYPGEEESQALIDFIEAIDHSVGIWSFSLRLMRHLLPMLVDYGEDEDDEDLVRRVKALAERLDKIIDPGQE